MLPPATIRIVRTMRRVTLVGSTDVRRRKPRGGPPYLGAGSKSCSRAAYAWFGPVSTMYCVSLSSGE
jgi:hypothetical protein